MNMHHSSLIIFPNDRSCPGFIIPNAVVRYYYKRGTGYVLLCAQRFCNKENISRGEPNNCKLTNYTHAINSVHNNERASTWPTDDCESGILSSVLHSR